MESRNIRADARSRNIEAVTHQQDVWQLAGKLQPNASRSASVTQDSITWAVWAGRVFAQTA